MQITIQEEKFANLLPDLKEALPLHYAETDPEGVFDPDYDLYMSMDEADMVKCGTIRVDGALAGYAVCLVTQDPHSKSVRAARIDFYWVHPGIRGNGAGKALFTFTEKMVKDAGAQRLLSACKTRLSDGALFEKLGFAKYETVFEKWLEE